MWSWAKSPWYAGSVLEGAALPPDGRNQGPGVARVLATDEMGSRVPHHDVDPRQGRYGGRGLALFLSERDAWSRLCLRRQMCEARHSPGSSRPCSCTGSRSGRVATAPGGFTGGHEHIVGAFAVYPDIHTSEGRTAPRSAHLRLQPRGLCVACPRPRPRARSDLGGTLLSRREGTPRSRSIRRTPKAPPPGKRLFDAALAHVAEEAGEPAVLENDNQGLDTHRPSVVQIPLQGNSTSAREAA
jgi:hypothetical protein